MAIWYLDTSAFLKLLVAEEHSARRRDDPADGTGGMRPDGDRADQSERDDAQRGSVAAVFGFELAGGCRIAPGGAGDAAEHVGDRAPDRGDPMPKRHHRCRMRTLFLAPAATFGRCLSAGGWTGARSGYSWHCATLTLKWMVNGEAAAVARAIFLPGTDLPALRRSWLHHAQEDHRATTSGTARLLRGRRRRGPRAGGCTRGRWHRPGAAAPGRRRGREGAARP